MNSPVRILVVDDSAVVRGLLNRALSDEHDLSVVGSVRHGEDALSWLKRHEADIMLLDVEMPVMDGLTTLKHVQTLHPELNVVMVSSQTNSGADSTLQALAQGAVACVAKPVAQNTAACVAQLATDLKPLLRELAGSRPRRSGSVTTQRAAADANNEYQPSHHSAVPPEVLVVGASTGGPQALSTFLTSLPRTIDIPIVIVQHMPPMFTATLAVHLSKDCGRPGQEAEQGQLLQPDHLYIAPGEWHVELSRNGGELYSHLHQGPPEHFCRPSVNPLFRSAAECCGAATLAVMLTGMGSDGLEGTRDIKGFGGRVIAQDEPSSVVWGMPGAIARENLADQVLPLSRIGDAVAEIVYARDGVLCEK